MRSLGRLDLATTVFLCCDVQEPYRSAIHRFPTVLQTSQRMLAAARMLSIPRLATQHYPKDLKPRAAELDTSGCFEVRVRWCSCLSSFPADANHAFLAMVPIPTFAAARERMLQHAVASRAEMARGS